MKDYRESIAFPVLDARHLDSLRETGTSCEFSDGEVLFAEGDRGFDFFIVEEGQVEILEHSTGSESTITIHDPGEFTGDLDMLTGGQLISGRASPPEAFQSLGRSPHFLETSVPGVFAVGDVRSGSVKRVASAVGEGSMAVSFVHQYLARG